MKWKFDYSRGEWIPGGLVSSLLLLCSPPSGAWQDHFVAPLSHFLNECFLFPAAGPMQKTLSDTARGQSPGRRWSRRKRRRAAAAVRAAGGQWPRAMRRRRPKGRRRSAPGSGTARYKLGQLARGELALDLPVFPKGSHSSGNLLSQHVAMSLCRLKFVCLESTVHWSLKWRPLFPPPLTHPR